MAQPIPNFWEQEREWKIVFPTLGNGNGNKNSIPFFLGMEMKNLIPDFLEREWDDVVIPGNDREREREWCQIVNLS